MRGDMHIEAKTATAAFPPSVAYLFHTIVAGNSGAQVTVSLSCWSLTRCLDRILRRRFVPSQVLQSWDYFQSMLGVSPAPQDHVDLPVYEGMQVLVASPSILFNQYTSKMVYVYISKWCMHTSFISAWYTSASYVCIHHLYIICTSDVCIHRLLMYTYIIC